MRHILVLAVLLGTALASGPTPVSVVPVERVEGRRTGLLVQRPDWLDRPGEPVPVWTLLEGMGPEARANAVITFDLGHASAEAWVEARAIEQMWNAGDFNGAIERLRNIGNFHDPCDIDVGMSWRKPIPTMVGADWGTNVRVGNRDSVYEIEFDRNNRTGNLFLASVRDSGALSCVNVYMSTDLGSTWSETYNMAVTTSYINAIGAVSNGSHFYVGYTRHPNQTVGRVMRFDADSGNQVRFANDSFYRTMFEADSLDSITEIEMTSTDDQFPAERIYAAGCTKGRMLLWGWTDSLAIAWSNSPNPNVNYCDGGLALTYNYYYNTSKPVIWMTWIYERNDSTSNVGFSRYDTAWHNSWFTPGFAPTYSSTTVGSWKDTTCIVYVHSSGASRYLQQIYTYDAGSIWHSDITLDTVLAREHPDISARYGRGFQLAARQYSGDVDRDLVYSRTGYTAQDWSPPLDISDYQPGLSDPQVMFVYPGTYGCAYIKWYQTPDAYSIWYDRSDWSGVEDVGIYHPKFGLEASIGRGRAELRFQNPRRGPVSLRVYDAAGRMVSRETRTLGAGEQAFEVTARNSGVHFAVIDIGGETATTRLTFAR
jgi:hypothetical protein